VEALLAQVLFEDAVLFAEVGDHIKLSAIHPSREGHEENPASAKNQTKEGVCAFAGSRDERLAPLPRRFSMTSLSAPTTRLGSSPTIEFLLPSEFRRIEMYIDHWNKQIGLS
jgi:hypothetical protein